MTATVKLPEALEAALRQRCQQEGRTLSEVIRDAVAAYLAREPELDSPWALGESVFGRYEGSADLATDRKRAIAEVWAARDAQRQPG